MTRSVARSVGMFVVATFTAGAFTLAPVSTSVSAAKGRFGETSPELGEKVASEGGQVPKGVAKPWTMPRTPDGKPDLQGNWSNATLTPLERPKGQGLLLTEAQAAQIENRTQQVKDFRDQPSDPNRPA